MNTYRLIIFSVIFCSHLSLSAKTDIKAMLQGMGQTFGAPPIGYVYNYEVFSDAHVPIYIEQEAFASFMGAFFPSAKGIFGQKKLPAIFDVPSGISHAICHKQNYYFNMYISDDAHASKKPIYKESLMQLPFNKNDSKIYYYHVYSARAFEKGSIIHKPCVESMGFADPAQANNSDAIKKGNVVFSSQLSSISFYNSSSTDVQISLTYGSAPYTFTIEKYSYNFLGLPTPESTDSKQATIPVFSLRPNTIKFAAYDATKKEYIPFKSLTLSDQGFDNVKYVIEIFQDSQGPLQVGIQGFNPGNYDLPVTTRVRDVTPCPCTFWYQSFVQAKSVEGYTDLPGQIWVIYGGQDSPIASKVVPGQAVSWNLTRPLLSQADQFVYFVYVVTDDDAVAAKFVQKCTTQLIGKNVIDEYNQALQRSSNQPVTTQKGLDVKGTISAQTQMLSAEDQVAVLMGTLSTMNGVIEDTEQGVVGYLVGADAFTPRGVGFGRFYYTLAPSILSFDTIATLVAACLDSSKTTALGGSSTDIQKSIHKSVQNWFMTYMKNPAQAQALVEKYLVQFGNTQVVNGKTQALTEYGRHQVQTIVSGSVSLKYPSMKLSTVTNQYVLNFGKSAPDKMPKAVMIAQSSQSTPDKMPAAVTIAPPSKSVTEKSAGA